MKVLQINAVYSYMSTGRTCLEFHDYLYENGVECITAYGERKGKYSDTFYVGNVLDHKLHAFLSRLTGKIGYFSYLPTHRLLRRIKHYKPDVVHIRNLHSNFVNIPVLLRFLSMKDIPVVVSLHDCFWYTGKCCHYTINNCYKWKEKCGDCQYLKEWNKSWFLDRTRKMQQDKHIAFSSMRRVAVIGVAKWVTEEAKKSYVFSNVSKIIHINNWVDLRLFRPRPEDIRQQHNIEHKFVILCVSSVFDKAKGLYDIIKVARKLPKDNVIILLGKVVEEKDIILPKNVIHVDQTSDVETLVDYYNAADLFLQLSREETGSKVMMEAISCGTPIVVYSSTCGAEYCEGGCGYCIDEYGNIDGIINAIGNVQTLGKEFFSTNCVIKAQENFNKEINCKEILSIYKELIEM